MVPSESGLRYSGALGVALIMPNLEQCTVAILEPLDQDTFESVRMLAKHCDSLTPGSNRSLEDLPDGAYDAVLLAAHDINSLLAETAQPSLQALFRELQRVIRLGGFLYLSVSHAQGSPLKKLYSRIANPRTLAAAVAQSDFTLSDIYALFWGMGYPTYILPTFRACKLANTLQLMSAVPHIFPFVRTPLRRVIVRILSACNSVAWIRACSPACGLLAYR